MPYPRWQRLMSVVASASLLVGSFAPTVAAQPVSAPTSPSTVNVPASAAETAATYIVLLKAAPVALYDGTKAGYAATNPQVLGTDYVALESAAVQSYRSFLAQERTTLIATIERQITQAPLEVLASFDLAVNALSVRLTPSQAAQVAKLPGVLSVQVEQIYELDTDVGPAWIGAPAVWDGSATGVATKGEGVVVAVFDTGINMDHPSFADVGGDGYDHVNPLGAGNYLGWCNPGQATQVVCNDKLFGTWSFTTDQTPEDNDSHGSHTASTAAGNVVNSAMLIGAGITFTTGLTGVAPHANIIAYDVCTAGCPGTALLAAVNQVITDDAALAASGGIDVINYSISGGNDPYNDAMSLGFLSAANVGILTSASAGNSGPGVSTNGHSEPWNMTVAASTHNRLMRNTLANMNGTAGSPPADMVGKGPTAGYGPAQIVYAGAAPYNNPLCNPFPANTFSGQIVVCDRGTVGRVQKSINVAAAGGGGFVLANDAPSAYSLNADVYAIPGVHLTYVDGVALKAWLAVTGTYTATILGFSPDYTTSGADIMAGFSSRGPSLTLPDVIKPDLTAPGVDILAAVANAGSPVDPQFNLLSGTSMSAPHAAGAAALMRALYPTWTPAQIKSALMLGTVATGIRKEDTTTASDPFDRGAGRIDLASAASVGFVLNETTARYQAANPATGGDIAKLNLASLAEDTCIGACSWTRTVRSVYNVPVTYTISFTGAAGLSATITPNPLVLNPAETKVITVNVDTSGATAGTWTFGRLDFAPSVAPIVIPTGGSTYTYNTVTNIPDNNAAGVTTAITVAETDMVMDVNLWLSATHSFVGDLAITMTSPNNTVVVPFDRPGRTTTGFGCSGNNLPNITLDDDPGGVPGTPVETSCINVTASTAYTANGSFTPNNPLAGFDGQSMAGVWSLRAVDAAGGDTGTLNEWRLTIVTATQTLPGDPPAAMQMPVAVKPSTGIVPSPVRITALSNTGSVTVTGLVAAQVTDLQTGEFGLTKAWVNTQNLAVDPTNGDPYNNDGGTFYVTRTVTAGDRRLVAEIVASTSLDIDLFVGRDLDGDGPEASEQLAMSATGAVLEYISLADPAAGTYWILVQNWDDSQAADPTSLAYVVVPAAASTNLMVTGPATQPSGVPFSVTVAWNEPTMAPVEYWYGGVDIGTDGGNAANIGTMAINLVRTSLPEVEVNAANVSSTQGTNTVATRTLTISNTGAQPLNWNIQEWSASAPATPEAPSSTGAGAGNVAETVDNAVEAVYSPKELHSDVPATYTPEAPTAILYSNGPIINAPGTGPGGSNGSVLQNVSLGMNIFGYAHQTGFRVADDFTVPLTESWQISSIRFYAYQTGGVTATSSINSVNLRIWNGPPGTGTVVFGDTATNRLVSSAWSGVYRYTENGVGTTRPIMSDTVAVSVTLQPGTYWLDWQTNGTIASGPWAPPIAITGVLTTGNGIQTQTTDWSTSSPLTMTATGHDPLIGVRQGLPFIIEGTPTIVGGCGTNIPWVSVTPSSGALAGFSATNVNVVYNSTGLANGTYTGTLCLNSNDPDEAQTLIPVTLTVGVPTLDAVASTVTPTIYSWAYVTATARDAGNNPVANWPVTFTMNPATDVWPGTTQPSVAWLWGSNEVPANTSPGTGVVTFTYNATNRMLTYIGSVQGLSGTITAAHIHTGTAGVAGPVLYPLNITTGGTSSVISGTVGPLSQASAAALYAGGLYVNVHSSVFAGGEVRGQIYLYTNSNGEAALGFTSMLPVSTTITAYSGSLQDTVMLMFTAYRQFGPIVGK